MRVFLPRTAPRLAFRPGAASCASCRANISSGTYNGSLIALQHFIAQGHGKLINVYGAGDKRCRHIQNAYGSSKAWVRAFTETLAKEYKDRGVEVMGFNPGLVVTDMLSDVQVVPGYEEAVQPLATVVRLWGNPPAVPARKAAG